jgi:hypothetical protein
MMRTRYSKDNKGFSVMIATVMTVVVLLVLGSVMYFMAIEVTPSSNPVIGALSCTRNDPGNYTVRVIALTNYDLDRDKFMVVVQPNNASIFVGKIAGDGQHLNQGDCFIVGGLQPAVTYSIYVVYKPTGSAVASLDIFST